MCTLRFRFGPRFYKDDVFDGLEVLEDACKAEGIGMVEAAYRWLLHHSGNDL